MFSFFRNGVQYMVVLLMVSTLASPLMAGCNEPNRTNYYMSYWRDLALANPTSLGYQTVDNFLIDAYQKEAENLVVEDFEVTLGSDGVQYYSALYTQSQEDQHIQTGMSEQQLASLTRSYSSFGYQLIAVGSEQDPATGFEVMTGIWRRTWTDAITLVSVDLDDVESKIQEKARFGYRVKKIYKSKTFNYKVHLVFEKGVSFQQFEYGMDWAEFYQAFKDNGAVNMKIQSLAIFDQGGFTTYAVVWEYAPHRKDWLIVTNCKSMYDIETIEDETVPPGMTMRFFKIYEEDEDLEVMYTENDIPNCILNDPGTTFAAGKNGGMSGFDSFTMCQGGIHNKLTACYTGSSDEEED